jgi:hypothetical protein
VPDNALWWLGGGVAILTALAALNNPRHFWGYESGDGIYEQDMADGMVAILWATGITALILLAAGTFLWLRSRRSDTATPVQSDNASSR